MKSKLKFFSGLLLAVVLSPSLFASVAIAAEEAYAKPLAELSSAIGQEVKDVAGAKEACNQEKYFVACAEIGKKYGLYKADQVKQVDAVLTELKGSISDELKNCADETCLLGVANKLASKLVSKNPTLATNLDLTSKKIEDKRTVINAAKDAGVNLQECQNLDPDSASVDMLRACAKLAKNTSIQKFIPRAQAEMADKSVDLKAALASGKYSCGDNTLDGCGKFCMSPIATERGKEPPAVCKQIATEVFGAEGVAQLTKAYDQVGQATDFYHKQTENLVFKTEDGRELYNPAEIGNYLQGEGQKGNVEAVDKGLDFMIANGFAKPEDKGFVLKMVKQARDGGGMPDFDKCAKDPESCEAFIPEGQRAEFKASSGVRDIMFVELKKEGINNPSDCQYPENGDKCVAASKRALPQLDALVGTRPEARRMADEIRRNIKSGEQGQQSRDEAMKKFQSDGKINISGQEFSNFGDLQRFCQGNGQACLAEGARQDFVPRDFAAQKFEQSVNIQGDFEQHNQPQQFQNFRPGQFPGQNPQGGFPGQGGQYGNPEGQPYQPQFGQFPGQNPQGGRQSQGFGEGFDKQKALEQFQKFLEDPSKNPMPSFQMGPSQGFGVPQQPGQFPGQNPQGGFPGQGGQYGNPQGQPYQQGQSGQYQNQNAQGNFPGQNPEGQPYQPQQDQRNIMPSQQPYQPPFINGDSINKRQSPDDNNFPCPAVMPRVCSPGEQPRFTGGRCQPYSCELDRTLPLEPQPSDPSAGCVKAGGTWDTASNYCKMSGVAIPPGPYQGGGQVSHTWRFADGSQFSQILSRTDGEYQGFIRGVDEQCLKITKDKFAWKQGAGDSASSNWQNFGIPDCSGNTTQTITTCPSGQYMKDGVCVVTSTHDCTNGQWWDYSSQTCKTTSTNKCADGQYWDGTVCLKSSTNCGAGYYWNGSSCQTTCASGEYWTGTRCESSAGTGAAKCNSDQYWDGSSQTCKSSNTTTTTTSGSSCTSSQYWNGTACVDGASSGQTCPGGQYVNGACSYGGSSAGGTSCAVGQYWNGSSCVNNTTGSTYSSDPATGCSQAGGTWSASSNYCQMPGQMMPTGGYTMPSGSSCSGDQYWNGSSCVSNTTMPSSGSYTPPSSGSYVMPSGDAVMPPPGATLFGAVKNFLTNLFK